MTIDWMNAPEQEIEEDTSIIHKRLHDYFTVTGTQFGSRWLAFPSLERNDRPDDNPINISSDGSFEIDVSVGNMTKHDLYFHPIECVDRTWLGWGTPKVKL